MVTGRRKELGNMETVTIKDIARICRVGVSTVSRAMNNHPDINQETKDRILETVREYNYIPNNSARNLKRSDSRTIAVLIKGISNPFFASMIKILEEEIEKRKYSFVLHRVEDKEDEVDVALELVKEKRLCGIIFLGGYFSHCQEELDKLSVPFVLSTIGIVGDMDINAYSSVSVDDREESYKMTDYLCRLGHEKILILAARPDDESIGKLRLEGYQKALRDHGIPFEEERCIYMREDIESYSMENGYCGMKVALESGKEFTAVYAISDSLAIGACKAILDSGKSIPDDYSVAGFDGLDIGRYYNPTLTTIRQPVEEMARATGTLLFDVMKRKEGHQQLVFPGELVIGRSTRCR